MKILRLRIALYIIAFVATFAITYLLKTDGAADKTDTRTMSEAGLPVVYMVSEEGTGYNYLYGYNSEINYSELHGVITQGHRQPYTKVEITKIKMLLRRPETYILPLKHTEPIFQAYLMKSGI